MDGEHDDHAADDITELVLNTSPDQLLQALVALVNDGRIPSLRLNLWVGGQILTGALVGAARYLDETAALLEQARSGEEIRSVAALHRDLALAAQVWSTGDAELPLYIHLMDVAVVTQESRPTVAFWRGRLARVDGWSFADAS